MSGIPLLTLLLAIPVAAGLLIALVRREGWARPVSLVASLIVFILALVVTVKCDRGPGLSLREDVPWVPAYGIHYKVGVDGISAVLVLLTAFLMPLAIFCSWKSVKDRPRAFFASLLFLETGMLGAFCAADLFLFYVFWEAMLLPMYLLIGIWGGPRRVYAAVKFILYTAAGSLLMFVAILYCWFETKTFDMESLALQLPGLAPSVQLWLFGAFAVAFAIKVPLFPFHTWLPDAHVEAPTAGSVILAGVLLKLGTYGFLRLALPFFPDAAETCSGLFVTLSVIGIIYGSLMAMAQSDIKRLIAYSSVAHLGFVMLGLFAFDRTAAQGAVLQMVNHGLSTGALFMMFGMLYDRTHRRSIEDFGGLARVMPWYATAFVLVSLSSIGLPGLNGFVGEFLVLLGTFQHRPVAAGLAGLGVILGAVYMLGMIRQVFFGKVNQGQNRAIPDLTRGEVLYLLPVIVLIVVLGVRPGLVLEMTEAPVARIYELFIP